MTDLMPLSTQNNYICEYFDWMQDNRDMVCNKIFKTYAELVRIMDDNNSVWEYSENKANHVITFIEKYCKHSKGSMGGKPLILELWQKALVSAMFGFVHKIDGTRKHQEVLLIVARKNGKSVLSSAIGIYLMIADGEAGADVVACATKRDQAKIIWLESKLMVKKSPTLLKRIKPLVGEMVSSYNNSSFRPLGADSDTLDGLNIHCGLLDEIHAWKTKDLYDVIKDGTTAREQPLIFITSTAGTIRESIFDILYDEAEMIINGYGDNEAYQNDRMLPIIYELDARTEWTDSKYHVKANPGLGSIKKIDQLGAKVNKAKQNALLQKNLLCKDFNIRETSTEAWLPFDDIINTEKFNVKTMGANYGIGGVDLSSTTDLTAAKVIFMLPCDDKIYVLQMYWLPHDLLEQRTTEDKIPYDVWRDMGLLRVTPGNSVHAKYVTEWFLEVMNEYGIYLPWIGYDAWSAKYWVEEMRGYFGVESMIPVYQGKKTLSAPMRKLGADLKSKLIIYNNNPIDKWCLSNTAIDIDKNDNIQPIKTSKSRKRIDGTAALLNAYVILQNKIQDYQNMV